MDVSPLRNAEVVENMEEVDTALGEKNSPE
jgi:hypothetical protein